MEVQLGVCLVCPFSSSAPSLSLWSISLSVVDADTTVSLIALQHADEVVR